MKSRHFLISILSACVVAAIMIASPSESQQPPSKQEVHEEHDHDHVHSDGGEKSGEEHEHSEEKPSQDAEHGHNHAHEEQGGEHGHEEEEASDSVGPDKGILAADEESGIQLAPEATKNFDIQTLELRGPGPWQIPLGARLLSGEEINLYRFREGFYRRVDFQESARTPQTITISSKDLRAGDAVVVQGIGFLRIAELAAFGGVAHGHSH